MTGTSNGRGGAFELLRDRDNQLDFFAGNEDVDAQYALFGLPSTHEQAILAEARAFGTLVQENQNRSPARSMFGTPAWYEERCAQISRACWREELTAREATALLDLEHGLVMSEMQHGRLWRKPRRGRGVSPFRRRLVGRFRGRRCPDCRRFVGPFTGICAPCHFEGWWW
jgi:hypothetical protein